MQFQPPSSARRALISVLQDRPTKLRLVLAVADDEKRHPAIVRHRVKKPQRIEPTGRCAYADNRRLVRRFIR